MGDRPVFAITPRKGTQIRDNQSGEQAGSAGAVVLLYDIFQLQCLDQKRSPCVYSATRQRTVITVRWCWWHSQDIFFSFMQKLQVAGSYLSIRGICLAKSTRSRVISNSFALSRLGYFDFIFITALAATATS